MKIFISHSSIDQEIAQALVQLIKEGIGVEKSAIFCSSANGVDVPIGANFQNYIKKELRRDGIVIALITKNYYGSIYSMYELGAAWANSKTTIPVLLPPMDYGNLKDFLSHIVAVKADDLKSLNKLRDELQQSFGVQNNDTNSWEESREVFINKIKEIKERPQELSPVSSQLRLIPSLYKYKVVAFDLDGTLLQGDKFKYSWQLIWNYLDYPDELRKKLYNLHIGNPSSYSYRQWCEECAYYFKLKKFHRNDIKKILRKHKITPAPTLKTMLEALKKRGIITAIISGGIDTFYEYGLHEGIRRLIDKVYINSFVYDNEGYLKEVIPHVNGESDFSGKLKVLEKLCYEANCNIDEAVFVGEGYNDREIGMSKCLSIAYPGKFADALYKSVADIEISDRNICAILPEIFIASN